MNSKKLLNLIWPLFGLIVMIFSAKMLYHEFHNPTSELSRLNFHDLITRLKEISTIRWISAFICTILAYTALAAYDQIALQHLKKKISWWFVSVCSFTAYALSHSIGASAFSGAAIRYRAYSTKGLSGPEVAILAAFCSFTFALGIIILLTILLAFNPSLGLMIKPHLSHLIGHYLKDEDIKIFTIAVVSTLTLLISLYVFGSWMHLRPLKIGKHITIVYPRLNIVFKQIIVGPLEILASSGIIYFMLPSTSDVSFAMVTTAFLSSFTIGILSNAPGGGLGIFELSFLSLFHNVDPRDVLVALIVFRMFYIIIPLLLSIIFVIIFEIKQYRSNRKH